MKVVLVFLSCVLSLCTANTIFVEKFDDGSKWEDRWVQSQHKSDYGKFVLDAGKYFRDAEDDKGIKTSQDARFYASSVKFPEAFDNKDSDLIIQFAVKHEQNIDCGGGYLKVFDCSVDLKDFHGESPYKIMFGPDICGPGTRKVHVILNYKGENKMIKKEITAKADEYSHLYQLKLSPDNTYEVQVDGEVQESGSLEDSFDFLAPKKIKDPEAKKPEDWDDKPKIDDPEDTKPEDWDQPEHIKDPDATKPEDWDDEMDGEWEPPMIDNPDYKGVWAPKQIDNPNYKGVWVHPEIPNPDYTPDSNIYNIGEICGLGFDLWQVKSGTIFDNILVTSDVKEAETFTEEFKKRKDAESEKAEAAKKEEAERMKKEEEEKEKDEDAAEDEDLLEEDDKSAKDEL